MKSKKAQSDMITTILLILVALAAIAIIAVFITNQVRSSTNTAAMKATCLKVDLILSGKTSAGAGVISVQRNGGSDVTVKGLSIALNGTLQSNNCPNPIPVGSICSTNTTFTTVVGDKIDVSPIITASGVDYSCPAGISTTVTAI